MVDIIEKQMLRLADVELLLGRKPKSCLSKQAHFMWGRARKTTTC
jgi:hypothetical protein